MEKLVIQGGYRLEGSVRIDGAKNAALPILFATLLNAGESEIHNVPDLWDISTACKLLSMLGAKVERKGNVVWVDSAEVNHLEAPYELVKTMRASVLVLGPLLARFNQAKVSLPGGCAIGARPVDQHIRGFETLGAEVLLKHGYIMARGRGLHGGRVVFDMPTVGGTENLMMGAVLGEGITVLQNCAREPEIIDLARFLRAMGARISGEGSSDIVIEGVPKLNDVRYEIMPDRIEAGTYMAAAAMTGGDVTLERIRVDDLRSVIDKFEAAGITIDELDGDGTQSLRVRRPGLLKAVDVKTLPYPGFPTDMQAQFMAMMTVAKGQSLIKETVFENRFMHVGELVRMGADIRLEGNTAVLQGVEKLQGSSVMATDLRASASLVLAGLCAEGYTEVNRIYHLDRGYSGLEDKLNAMGAHVERHKMDRKH